MFSEKTILKRKDEPNACVVFYESFRLSTQNCSLSIIRLFLWMFYRQKAKHSLAFECEIQHYYGNSSHLFV